MVSDRRRWNKLGSKEPYWAVVTDARYRSNRMDDEAFDAFFESGERDISATFETIRKMVGAEFHPARALDFGCGVGRLTIPLARESRHVVGVDISPSMLEEAEANCAERQVTNVELIDTRKFLKETNRRVFDFVHSYIVFQHIKPRHGLRLTARILDMLAPGGVGALHYTYDRKAGIVRKSLNRVRRWVPPLNVAANIIQRRRLFEPLIPMYRYNLRSLFELFDSKRCSSFSVKLTDHGGHKGAFFFLQKAR
jgi:SAM-dependent methyltransferase